MPRSKGNVSQTEGGYDDSHQGAASREISAGYIDGCETDSAKQITGAL